MTDAERIAELKTEVEATAARERSCTCHPDDKPPNPCMQKYALTECRIAELEAEAERLTRERDEALAKVLLWRDCFEEITAKDRTIPAARPPSDLLHSAVRDRVIMPLQWYAPATHRRLTAARRGSHASTPTQRQDGYMVLSERYRLPLGQAMVVETVQQWST
jgi:hypothetical protein